jgi:N,N-dimethylformamidase
MRRLEVMGYCDRLSVQPGETVRFMATALSAGSADGQLVRLLHGDEHPGGPGFVEREIEAGINGKIHVGPQATQLGNYIEISDPQGRLALRSSFTLYAFVYPTIPAKGRQTILGRWCTARRQGYEIGINDRGRLCARIGSGEIVEAVADADLVARVWYFVAATFDAEAGLLSIHQEPMINAYNSLVSPVAPLTYRATGSARASRCDDAGVSFLWGAHHNGPDDAARGKESLYNGKIDRAGVVARALDRTQLDRIRDTGTTDVAERIATWDTTAGYTVDGIGDMLVDTGPHKLHGKGHNKPVRGMTGYNWRGKDDCFRLAPEQYGGIHFHDDALTDCHWPPIAQYTIPQGLKSGVYALRLRKGGAEDHIVFFVRPAAPAAKIALLMPTASYLAYANEHLHIAAPGISLVTGRDLVIHDSDIELALNPALGRSTYDVHSDGAGVCYSSYRRPVLNLKPRHRMAAVGVPWQFPADLSIVFWLEQRGHDYDVLTDEDLHREGVECLRPYNVVLNGTHSEYYSERMLDATEQYVSGGGRLMYLGANGYYWVVGFPDDEPWCMEVRKLDSGSRAWSAAPGEHYLATTGEKSGLWRNRGRAPQKLTGVGFTSEGMDVSSPYRRMPDSYDPAVAWIFQGVAAEVFGDLGLALGGAGGLEIDRYDRALGTPPGTWLLASTEGHSDSYPHVSEELGFNHPGTGGTQDFQVRADMTYFTTGNGGAVFSTGSIAWGQALPWNGCDNAVSRITGNVLAALAADGPLPGEH